MTSRTSQRHVAVVYLGIVRPRSTTVVGFQTCGNFRWNTLRKWQSTIAKTVSESNGIQTTFNKNEVPSSCFVESPTYPEPSVKRSHGLAKVDLSTTRPAKLESPASLERRDYSDGNIPIADRAKYLFRLGKSYLSFYKTGLKNVWTNGKQYRSLRSKFQGNSLNTLARHGGQNIGGKAVTQISRSEYQLCLRARHDIFKMLPFSIVFLICGEFTPLAIIALGSSIVPYTCRIPRQEQKDLDTKSLQDKQYMEILPSVHPEVETPLDTPNWRIEHLDAYRLGLTSIRNPIPVLGPVFHALFTRPRLIRHCDNIVSDTLLIHREGGSSSLSHQDIYDWADAYGLYALRQHIRNCQQAGRDPRDEKIKAELLPKVDAEIKYMVEQVVDWSKLKPSEQWRVGLRTVGSQSPDWQARMSDIKLQLKQERDRH